MAKRKKKYQQGGPVPTVYELLTGEFRQESTEEDFNRREEMIEEAKQRIEQETYEVRREARQNPMPLERFTNIEKKRAGRIKATPTDSGVVDTYSGINEVDPFFSNWINHPESKKRLKEQLGLDQEGVDRMNRRLERTPIFHEHAVDRWRAGFKGEKNDYELGTLLKEHLNKQGLYPRSMRGLMRVARGKGGGAEFSPPNQTISIRGYDRQWVDSKQDLVHELTHASKLDEMFKPYISKTFPNQTARNYKALEDKHDRRFMRYLQSDGLYPIIMEIRQKLQLKPGEKLTPSQVKKAKGMGAWKDLNHFHDSKTIERMLNELASVQGKSNNNIS